MTQRVISGSTYNLTYDAENHLTGVSGAATATFVYDGEGNRVKGSVDDAKNKSATRTIGFVAPF
jgi:YD repeat-containing protein